MKKTTAIETIQEVFPLVSDLRVYFGKLESKNKYYTALKAEASKQLQELNFFNMKLTLEEVGSVLGVTRFAVRRYNEGEIAELEDFDSKKILKKCLRNSLYPVELKPSEKGKKRYKLVPCDEIEKA